MKEFGGYSATSYEIILEEPDQRQELESSFSTLAWKEKYDLCNLQVKNMNGNYRFYDHMK